jgi:hypothetical protein
VKNRIFSCALVKKDIHFDGNIFYEYYNGLLRFAIVKAEDEDHAKEVARGLIDTLAVKKANKTTDA